MANILNARDILTGSLGKVYATLADGRRMDMMHVVNIEANVSYDKEQVPILGKVGKANRKTGETYSGSMTVYYLTSEFRKMAETYKGSGQDFYFDLQIINDDQTSHAGVQTIVLTDCNIDNMTLAKLDADASIIDEDMDFTFEDWRIEKEFDALPGFFD